MFAALKGWIPPNVVGRWSRGSPNIHICGSYEEAARVCHSGYQSNELVNVVVEKTRVLKQELERHPPTMDTSALRILMAVALAGTGSRLQVLDFGGAAGQHFFVTRRLFSDRVFDWRVVETPAMVGAASSLAEPELSFFESIQEATASWAAPPDLVFASGVLMYLADPMPALQELIGANPRILYITRTGLSTGPKAVHAIQYSQLSANGPGPLPPGYVDRVVAYPNTALPMYAFESALEGRNFTILARFEEEKNIWQAAESTIHQYGYLCQRLTEKSFV